MRTWRITNQAIFEMLTRRYLRWCRRPHQGRTRVACRDRSREPRTEALSALQDAYQLNPELARLIGPPGSAHIRSRYPRRPVHVVLVQRARHPRPARVRQAPVRAMAVPQNVRNEVPMAGTEMGYLIRSSLSLCPTLLSEWATTSAPPQTPVDGDQA